MQISVNGSERVVEEGTTISDLLKQLAIRDEQIAVEVNVNIVDRTEFDSFRLKEHDTVEIISFIGGGQAFVF